MQFSFRQVLGARHTIETENRSAYHQMFVCCVSLFVCDEFVTVCHPLPCYCNHTFQPHSIEIGDANTSSSYQKFESAQIEIEAINLCDANMHCVIHFIRIANRSWFGRFVEKKFNLNTHAHISSDILLNLKWNSQSNRDYMMVAMEKREQMNRISANIISFWKRSPQVIEPPGQHQNAFDFFSTLI